jgi:hypothetical protein
MSCTTDAAKCKQHDAGWWHAYRTGLQSAFDTFTRAGSASSSRASSNSGHYSSQVQADFRIMQELLRRDYAVGYIMLGWLLRCTWAVTPAIALLLKLPQPAMVRATRQQLPVLLSWLLFGGGHAHDHVQQRKVAQLSPEALKDLQEQLVGPTAAVACYASFAKTYQLLANAPVTAQQVSSPGRSLTATVLSHPVQAVVAPYHSY